MPKPIKPISGTGAYVLPLLTGDGTAVSATLGDYRLDLLSISSDMVKTEWGELVVPQFSASGTMSHEYYYTGYVTNKYNVPIGATVCVFSIEDDTLVDSASAASDGSYSFTTTEPCYLVSLPDRNDMDGLGWSRVYG